MGKYSWNYGKEIKLDNAKDFKLAISLHLSSSLQPYWCTKSIKRVIAMLVYQGCRLRFQVAE